MRASMGRRDGTPPLWPMGRLGLLYYLISELHYYRKGVLSENKMFRVLRERSKGVARRDQSLKRE